MKNKTISISVIRKKRSSPQAIKRMENWIKTNPGKKYLDYRKQFRYLPASAVSFDRAKKRVYGEKPVVEKLQQEPVVVPKIYYTELLNAAVNTVVALRCNPDINLAMNYAENTLRIANIIASDRLELVTSIERIIDSLPKMSKEALRDNLSYLIGKPAPGSVLEIGKRIQEIGTRLERAIPKAA